LTSHLRSCAQASSVLPPRIARPVDLKSRMPWSIRFRAKLAQSQQSQEAALVRVSDLIMACHLLGAWRLLRSIQGRACRCHRELDQEVRVHRLWRATAEAGSSLARSRKASQAELGLRSARSATGPVKEVSLNRSCPEEGAKSDKCRQHESEDSADVILGGEVFASVDDSVSSQDDVGEPSDNVEEQRSCDESGTTLVFEADGGVDEDTSSESALDPEDELKARVQVKQLWDACLGELQDVFQVRDVDPRGFQTSADDPQTSTPTAEQSVGWETWGDIDAAEASAAAPRHPFCQGGGLHKIDVLNALEGLMEKRVAPLAPLCEDVVLGELDQED